ncbi:AMP-binding protein [Endothiovibrio diazotrophicus]
MSALIDTLAHRARHHPAAPALRGAGGTLDYATYHREVERFAATLRREKIRVLALAIDNGPAWAVADLAALRAGTILLPLPAFFSPQQLRHAVEQARADALLCDRPEQLAGPLDFHDPEPVQLAATHLALLHHPRTGAPMLPAGTTKITFTSGTSGTPKGVCLDEAGQLAVARSLIEASGAGGDDRHLCLLPLATLLENIGGLYAPLLAGAEAVVPSLAEVGLRGASGIDPARLAHTLLAARPTTAIVVPAMLQALLHARREGAPSPPSLRFLAVGGAKVAATLLEEARGLGLPVYQGYGLSECASVVTLNRPDDDAPGSVGRPLPHLQLEIAADGEVLVHGPRMLGYLGEIDAPPNDAPWPTGDLGHIDDQGRLHLTGRKRDLFITAFGRNLAPDWVEAELTAHPALPQAVLYGDGRPWNAALLYSPAPDPLVEQAVAAANRRLPDYARITRWLRAEEPFTLANGLATANGRPRREAIAARYGAALAALYTDDTPGEPAP